MKKMKKFLYIAILISLNIKNIYPQISINNYRQSLNKIEFEINLPGLPYQKNIKGDGLYVDFNNYMDESNPGSSALPGRDIIIALPSYSTVSVSLNPLVKNKIKGKPDINPGISLGKAGEVLYTRQKGNYVSAIKNILEIKGYLWIKNYYCVHIRINQYLASNDIIEELQKGKLSLQINSPDKIKVANNIESDEEKTFLSSTILNYQNSKQLDKKYFEPGTSNYDWIDFSKTYLKIGTARDGIYRITSSDLEQYGINTSTIPLNTFRLFSKGVEVPILTKGSDVLTDSGYIEFFGKRNMGGNYRETSGPNEPYKEYLDRYSDTTVYWLTWGGNSGLRTPDSFLYSGNPVDTVKYYSEIVHYEENPWLDFSMENLVTSQEPMWKQNQTWVWGQQQPGKASYPFQVSDFFPGKNAQAFYKVQDYASNDITTTNIHQIGLSINSDPVVYDSVRFDRYAQRVVKAVFNSNLLVNGNNTLYSTFFPTSASLNSVEYDWYEVEYPRYLKAINDSLKFIINDQQGKYLRLFKITNLNAQNIILYKYDQEIKKITNYTFSGNELYFADSVSSGDKYYLINESKIGSPIYFYKKNFTDIASSGIQADYILITHPIFLQKANEYASFISQNYSVTTKVINIFDIYDQFNYGFFSPEPIRDFLILANTNWGAPKPTYLFLVGDANYDYYSNKVKYFQVPNVLNFVPSFGEPVSDTWFTIWDSTGALIPQLFVGRLPASSIEEFQHFFDKHKAYLNQPFDDWNKYYLLFSGGNGDDPSEISLLKGVNDDIANLIQSSPTGGIPHHLYKTYDPRTNFGPYTEDQVNNMISWGGVFISYVGHGGTQTWDNGINDVNQLKNNLGRSSFISDFGCSTGKFAEPDIKAFAELFVNGLQGDAIGYIGNSTLGFTSTTSVYPQLFYKKILKENITTLGMAHVLAKTDFLNTYGSGGVYEIFVYGNTLFSDPIIKVKVPPKPNLSVTQKDISLDKDFLDESIDSAVVKIKYYNYGMVLPDTFNIQVVHSINGVEVKKYLFTKTLPNFMDSLLIKIPIKGFIGNHKVDVSLDADNQLEELYKNDDSTSYSFNVASNAVRTMTFELLNNICNGAFILINPVNKSVSDSVYYQVSGNPDFVSPQSFYRKFDTAYTKITLLGLQQGSRYWFRSKINSPTEQYGASVSFIYDSASAFSYYMGDSLSFANSVSSAVDINHDGIRLGRLKKDLNVISAAFNEGSFAVISINKNDYLTSGHLDGIHIVVFSDPSLDFEYTIWFNYWDHPDFSTAMYKLLDTLPNNKIVCFANAGNAGIGISDSLRAMLHSYGSQYIDSIITYPYSWAMIGKKGALPGSVPEKWSKPFGGSVTVDSVFYFDSQTGTLSSSTIGPVKNWTKLLTSIQTPGGSSVSIIPVGIKVDGTKDTLAPLNIINGVADMTGINSSIYSSIQLVVNLQKGNDSIPSIRSIKLTYDNIPEIGTNYQVVKLSKDTVTIGEILNLNFKVLNEGYTKADSIKVRVERIKPDNSKETVSEALIDSLQPAGFRSYNVVYNTSGGSGPGSFSISIDPDNKLKEFYKDNNVFSVPFYVKGDTARPNMLLTINGSDILDGDYISSNPKIKIELNDPTLLPLIDTTSVSITLNDSPVYYAGNSFLIPHFNSANPKMTVEYNPQLADGDYTINVQGKNALGSVTDSAGITKKFRVSSEAQLLDVYNYPNPFSTDTYFTFKLTQIPDELKIRIFTIAGRLIKEISKKSFELNYDFNRIYWDGKDQDGDKLANGVYLYKIIMKKGSKTLNVTQKLAIIK
jgi:hypothetical protein